MVVDSTVCVSFRMHIKYGLPEPSGKFGRNTPCERLKRRNSSSDNRYETPELPQLIDVPAVCPRLDQKSSVRDSWLCP